MKLLILLIGHNNLSNLSIVKFLKQKGFEFNKIVGVFTKATIKNFNNLKQLLKEDFVGIDVEDVKEDFLKVKNKINTFLQTQNNIEMIFLDYTGGLKSMSLGAFLAVNEFNLEEEKKYISYVFKDTETNKSKIIFKRGDVFELNYPLSLEEIAGTYDIFDLNYKTENSEFFSLENVYWLINKVKKEEKEFFENLWDKKNIRELNWKESLKGSNLPTDLSNKKLKKLQSYIKGNFLEEYLFYVLNKMKEELGIYEVAWNVKKGNSADFEIDVIASKDNDLYLFSCTTDTTKSRAKEKGFEAKERAGQLGGKNAKMVLVSCIDESIKEQLLKDLEEKKGGSNPEIITYQDLIDIDRLKQKLKDIFNAG